MSRTEVSAVTQQPAARGMKWMLSSMVLAVAAHHSVATVHAAHAAHAVMAATGLRLTVTP